MIRPKHLETVPSSHEFKKYCIIYITQNFKNFSQREISRRLGIGKTTVNSWARNQGLIYKKHTVNENYFKTWSEEMAYLLGYIITDGNVAWDVNKCYNSLTITAAAKDREHLEKLRKLIKSSKPLLYGRSTNSYRLIVANKNICKDLMKFGINPRKSKNVMFPEIPQKYISHFVRGVIDGDGSAKYLKRPRSPYFEISIASGSYDFISGLKKAIYQNIGTDSKISKTKTCYLLRYSCKRGKTLAKWIYKNTNLFLIRKYKNYQEAIHAENKKGN